MTCHCISRNGPTTIRCKILPKRSCNRMTAANVDTSEKHLFAIHELQPFCMWHVSNFFYVLHCFTNSVIWVAAFRLAKWRQNPSLSFRAKIARFKMVALDLV